MYSNSNISNKRIESKLNSGTFLIDFFIVLGPNPELYKKDWLYTKSIEIINKNYQKEIQPFILSKFPPIEKKLIGIDDTIISHCFPNGYQLEYHENTPKPFSFNILLDNANYSLDFPHKYVSCLKFYEPISNYKMLKDKENILTNNKIIVNHDINNNISNYYLPKIILFLSLYPYLNDYTQILKIIYINSTMIKQQIPIEKIIENIIISIPAPPNGIYSIEYNLLNYSFHFVNNKMNELPLYKTNYEKIFQLLSIKNIITIYKNILLNNKIIFFSKDISLLTPIIINFISFLFPFHYPFNIISILPKIGFYIIDGIMPFIIGINKPFTQDFYKENDIDINGTAIVNVDIDNNNLYLFKKNCNKIIPDSLPYYDFLYDELNNFLNKNKEKNEENTSEDFEKKIRKIFFKYNIKLMNNYHNYIDIDNSYLYINIVKNNPLEKAFKIKNFLNDINNEKDRVFYNEFINSQMFCDFIYKKITPKNKKEQLQIILFDEYMSKMNNKKNRNSNSSNMNCVLINTKDYDSKKKYIVQIFKGLDEKENDFFSDEQNKLNLINDGIYIMNNNNNLSFTYFIFPRIKSEFFYKHNSQSYRIFDDLNNEIEIINSDIITKKYIDKINKCNPQKILNNEMEDFIYLSWIKLWIYSFYYHDKKERNYIFNLLLNILDKISYHQMDIFDLLFKILLENNAEDNMFFKLYEKMISYKINPSLFIYDLIKKLIYKKEQSLNKSNTNSSSSNLNMDNYLANIKIENDVPINEFKERTLKSSNERLIINEKTLLFKIKNKCVVCQNAIDIDDISYNINHYFCKELLWLQCPNCNNNLLPYMKIKFGNEINRSKCMCISTSIEENGTLLYSPYSLYNNFIGNIDIKNNRIDIEKFKLRYSPIFWNLIFYFVLKNIPFFIFLPYKSSIESKWYSIKSKIKNNDFNISFNINCKPGNFEINKKKHISLYNENKNINIDKLLNIVREIEYEIQGTKDSKPKVNFNDVVNKIKKENIGTKEGDNKKLISSPTNKNSLINKDNKIINACNFIRNPYKKKSCKVVSKVSLKCLLNNNESDKQIINNKNTVFNSPSLFSNKKESNCDNNSLVVQGNNKNNLNKNKFKKKNSVNNITDFKDLKFNNPFHVGFGFIDCQNKNENITKSSSKEELKEKIPVGEYETLIKDIKISSDK